MKAARSLFVDKPNFDEGDFVEAVAHLQAIDISTQKNRNALETVVDGKSSPTPSNLRVLGVNVCNNVLGAQEPKLTWSAALPPVLAAPPGVVAVRLTPAELKSFAQQVEFAGPWFELIKRLLNAVSVEFIGQTKTDAGVGY